jgi:hypothetical protein
MKINREFPTKKNITHEKFKLRKLWRRVVDKGRSRET